MPRISSGSIRSPRTALCAAAAAALLSVLPGLSAHAAPLRWAAQNDVLTLDPHSQNHSTTNAIAQHAYEGLTRYDRQYQVEPALATKWTQTSPTTWRFELRKGVKFHDGSPFTADDVVFSFHRIKQPVGTMHPFVAGVTDIKKVDANTIDVILAAPNPILLRQFVDFRIMSKTWAEKNKAVNLPDFKAKEETFATRNANGTGPYRITGWQPDQRITMVQNKDWWDAKNATNVDEVIYTPIKSDPTRVAALLSGEIDFLLDPAPQDVVRLRNTPQVKVIDGPENRIVFIGMDQARDELLYGSKGRNPFKDLRVRKALYQAVDIETIRTKLMRGQAVPTGGITPSALGGYNDPELEKRLPFDLEAAKKLMAEAGFAQGFEVTLDCPNNRYINDEEICQTLAAMWAKLNVKVRVNAMPRATYFPKVQKFDTSMFMLGWGGSITDAEVVLTPVLRSRAEGGIGAWNFGGTKDAKLDELAAASSREPDPKKREQLIKAALKQHNDQVLNIPLHRQVIPWAARSNVEVVHRADNWLEWRWVKINQ